MNPRMSLQPKQTLRNSRPTFLGNTATKENTQGGKVPHAPMPSRPPPPLLSPADAEDASQDRDTQQADHSVELRALQRANIRLSGGPPGYAHPPPALVAMVPRLLEGVTFAVHRVWYKLDIDAFEGYFGIYWFCHTLQHKFTLHATLALLARILALLARTLACLF